ncbi:MAG: helix-turn-helix domain-containing protein [Actinomycetota bacterium]|nr:helix-turn-helix domain-containing protein [Actinomycetota bacterium]
MAGKSNVERVQVAAMLRSFREEAGATREQSAEVLGCTTSKIGDLETGRSAPRVAELDRLLDLYGVTGAEREDLLEFARASRSRKPRSKFAAVVIPYTQRRAADLEAQALAATFFSSTLVPGILQTEAYAETTLRWANTNSDVEVQRLLELRMGRKAALTRTDREPLRYWCILGEAALRTNLGGRAVMREQLAHLIEVNRTRENVVIQILPLESGTHSLLGMTVTLHRFPPPAPEVLKFDTACRDTFSDRETDVALTAHHMDLVRAMALGREESTTFMESVLRELEAGQ